MPIDWRRFKCYSTDGPPRPADCNGDAAPKVRWRLRRRKSDVVVNVHASANAGRRARWLTASRQARCPICCKPWRRAGATTKINYASLAAPNAGVAQRPAPRMPTPIRHPCLPTRSSSSRRWRVVNQPTASTARRVNTSCHATPTKLASRQGTGAAAWLYRRAVEQYRRPRCHRRDCNGGEANKQITRHHQLSEIEANVRASAGRFQSR